MTNRDRVNATLNFEKCDERGSVLETFFPWTKTIDRWKTEGLPSEFTPSNVGFGRDGDVAEKYLDCGMTDDVKNFESFFGFDPLLRVCMNPPFFNLSSVDAPAVQTPDDWAKIKEQSIAIVEKHYTEENIERIYGKYTEAIASGDVSCRLAVWGFFWSGFMLIGMENHLFSFYDMPEVLHDMAKFLVELYTTKLDKVLQVISADTVYIMEDLSGKNGPMLSPEHFDEFVGNYYRQLVPMLRKRGVKHILVDTDGDFKTLIPNFIDAGIEGFLPMDVNAGMDIVEVRKEFPNLKFIGAFNKLEITKGKEAIDREFERLMPVIRQGGFIPGSDHQVAPSTSMSDYQYYVKRLELAMKECGIDIR